MTTQKIDLIWVFGILLKLSIMVLSLQVVNASAEIYEFAKAEILLDVSSEIDVSGNIETLNANLSFIPKEDYRQSVDVDYGSGKEHSDHVIYSWKNPSDSIMFGYIATVRTSADFKDIGAVVRFPIKEVPDDINRYLFCTENLDCDNPDIISKASELASGKDDLFDVVFTLATYVTDNMEYDLSYSSKVEKASVVLREKKGVCSEYTSLFVALCRSIGIPAKYVSGEAYSNLEGIEGFGEHAWAEAYFPGYGWVPFDSTYGEYGMVDASHIALKKSVDSNEPSSSFEWLGKDGRVYPKELIIEASLKSGKDKISPFLVLEPKIMPELAIGSWGLLSLDVLNLLNKYVTTTIDLSRTVELDVQDYQKHIFLGPSEKKTLYWIFKIDSNLSDSMLYEFPVFIYTKQLLNESVRFRVKKGYPYYTKEEILAMIIEDRKDPASPGLIFDCISRPESFIGQIVSIRCTLENTGNTDIKGMEVCGFNECRSVDVPITHRKEEVFLQTFETKGRYGLNFSAGTEKKFLNINIVDYPGVDIKNISSPDLASPDDIMKISFVLSRTSESYPSNVKFYLVHKNIKKEWSTQTMISKKVSISENVGGGVLSNEDNRFLIKVEYEDMDGKVYCEDAVFLVNLRDSNFFQKVKLFIFDLFSTNKNDIDKEKCKR